MLLPKISIKEVIGKIKTTNIPLLSMYSTSSGLSQVLMMIYSLLVARWLGPELYGVLISCYVAAILGSILISWGMDSWLLRNAPIHSQPQELIGTILKIKMCFGIPWILGVNLLLVSLWPDTYPRVLLGIVTTDIWLDNMANTLLISLIATGRTKKSALLLTLSRSLRLIGAIILISLGSYNLNDFAIARLIVSCMLLLIGIIFSKPISTLKLQSNGKEIFTQSLTFGLSEFLAMVYGQVDLAMLSIMSNPASVGVYSPAVSIVNAIITVMGSIYTFYIPILTQKYQQGNALFLKSARNLILGFLIIGLLLSSLLAISAHWIVDLLLDDFYQQTGALLIILSPILLFKPISMGLAVWLIAVNRQSKRLWPQGISAAVNILLNLWAIPTLGVIGVAWVYMISEIVLTIGYAYWVIRSERAI